jgi:multiple sugar transport system permease protein
MTATAVTPERAAKRGKSVRPGQQPKTRLAHAIMGVGMLYFIIPLVWIVVAATKSQPDLLSSGAFEFGRTFHLFANLKQLFSEDQGAYGQWLRNSALYSGVSAVGATFLATLAGYGLARFSFRGKRFFESALLGMIMVPSTALVLPTYLLLARVHMVDTMWAVILPSLLSPFGAYLIRVYVAESVPEELLDAARIDGASEPRVFLRVAVPLMRPAVVTVFLFSLVATWNNYFLPLIMLKDPAWYPLTLGLKSWNAQAATAGGQTIFNLVITGSLLTILPLLAAFLLLQRFWQSGLAAGSVKD